MRTSCATTADFAFSFGDTKLARFVTRLAFIPRSHGYSTSPFCNVDRSSWKIQPQGYVDEDHIIQFWDDILRFIATIKLKETTASDIFRRLNSYSKQHGLYQALKAFGQP
jgi:TnpA family transposase